MAKRTSKAANRFGAACKPIDLSPHLNWPRREPKETWWQELAQRVRAYPTGEQRPWGIPFLMREAQGVQVVLVSEDRPEVRVPVNRQADFLCLLHEWVQMPADIHREAPGEGLVVAEYEIVYTDGSTHVQPVRARFEVEMAESPGPPWLAMRFNMWKAVDPQQYPPQMDWSRAQTGTQGTHGSPLVYALPNPHPDKRIRSLVVRGLQVSPLLVAGLTAYRGGSHPLRHLPRRTYRVRTPDGSGQIERADVDLGGVARIEHTQGPRGRTWLRSPHAGLARAPEPGKQAEDLVEAFGSEDASLEVQLKGKRGKLSFPLGQAFHKGTAAESSGKPAKLEVLGKRRQWMKVVVRDKATGKPTPARIHISGSRGEYIAPYGHHAQINTGWFMDYGADVIAGGRNYAYVHGEFTTDLPVGDLYIEIDKGFEHQPTRTKVTVKPGQKVLELGVERALDWRRSGWVTADTHVHFISPHTAWLEAQCEGVNVVNLLASQWGRLFTNVGDLTGKVGVVEDDTIVYVGTENRNHMLGHMSMLGTKGLPVFPMCCGGPGEAWVGDPDFMTLAEWAMENKRKRGVVIRPHYPFCGHTEDPVPILKGLVDALEIRDLRGEDFPTQEWYRYLNCGYRVAVAGGTDKMGAQTPLGWMRTHARLDPKRPFHYEAWAEAVRAGRTFSTTGPLIDLTVDGKPIGDAIKMNGSGGTLEVEAQAQCVWPLGKIEIVHNGRLVAAEISSKGAAKLSAQAKLTLHHSGWIAARCTGHPDHPGGYVAAHTSPVYVQVGRTRLFDGPAAQHMLALVEGGIEYLNTLATAFDEPSRKRMVKLFKEAQDELKGRLVVEADVPPHHAAGAYHTHGPGTPRHRH